MKIVILGPAHPYRGGIAALNERLALELQREGHEVTLVTFTLQYPGFLFPGKTQYTTDPPPEGLTITRKINAMNPLSWIRAGMFIRKMQPGLVIARFWIPFIGPSLGSVARISSRGRGTRVIGLADNIIPHEKKPGDRLLTSWFIRSCHAMVVMSESVLTDLNLFDRKLPRRYGPHPIYDHYGHIFPREEALARLGLSPAFRYLLFFGLVREYKGLDLVIDAMAAPGMRSLPVKLIVAGEFYANEEAYHQRVEAAGLTEQVIFHNRYIPNQEVENYFNAADMVVQPYKTATQSGVTQVAYHFGKPMLVTRVGGLPEIVADRKAGYVCTPEAREIAAALEDFFLKNRKEAFERYVAADRQRFSWDRFTQLFYDLMRELNPPDKDG
ncbi:MAG TPA: glycosyltransferase [Prolixibacteraceae bacterium]|jgi:glycosyltransferase involved in cell wall biosynthesis|nr:glycosyltransferase [Prolixibacteraceae bacterium]HRV90151.1 glycosyltransferase [Prolixibacteraceae bacterium]